MKIVDAEHPGSDVSSGAPMPQVSRANMDRKSTRAIGAMARRAPAALVNVLLVEDDIADARLIQTALRRNVASVRAAALLAVANVVPVSSLISATILPSLLLW